MLEAKVQNLLKNIYQRSLCLAVIGSGYVGLPTAALFADAGFHVTAIDIKPEIVKAVNDGFSPINEPRLDELISRNVQAGRLRATSSLEALTQADAVIVSVQTPIDQNKRPNLSFLMKAIEDVGRALREGMLIVVSSTIPPGTMLENVKPKLEVLSGLKVETDFYLAYVPERIAPGKAIREFVENPRLVGGVGPKSTKIASALYRTVCKTVIETEASTAEVAKLAENTFRDINIAYANQLALLCENYGVDVEEVIKLANTHPRVNIHFPGAGVGGPCLTKDPYLLISEARNIKVNLIRVAREINDLMPYHAVEIILNALRDNGIEVSKSKVALLGVAYKGGVSDTRNSPAETIINELLLNGVNVSVYDPYTNETFDAEKAESLEEACNDADLIAIITDHPEFRHIELEKIKELVKHKLIVDGRRIINPSYASNCGFKYYGIGYGLKSDESS